MGTGGIFGARRLIATQFFEIQPVDPTTLAFVRSEGETTLKYDLSWQLSNRLTLRGGGSWKHFRRSVDIAQPLGIDTPFSVQPRGDVPGVDLDLDATAQIPAGHVQLAARLLPRVTLTAGARIDHFQALDSTKIGPRVGVETSMTPRLTVSLSAGRYRQQPELTSIVARPENARLTPMEADHVVVGTAYQPRADVRITVEAYRKGYRPIPSASTSPN